MNAEPFVSSLATMAVLVSLPLLMAMVTYGASARWLHRLVPPANLVMLGAAALLALQVARGGPQRHALGGWAAPLGIELYADGLSALLILLSASVGCLVAAYARHYFSGDAGQAGFWPMWWLLWAALDAVFLSADAFNVYVTLELLGLSAVGLVVLGRDAAAFGAGLRYLLFALFGSLMYLLGVAFLYGSHGTLAFDHLANRISPGPVAALIIGLTVFGLALKSALFPLHQWLPPAHGSAQTPVSALLSALVVKASFYLLLRLWFDVYGAAAPVALAQGLGVLGAIAIAWGATEAFLQRRLKMLVAYSTVAQIGYLFLVFPLATGTPAAAAALGWYGAVYHALSHAFAKAAMFLAAGTIVRSLGEDDIEHLEGTATRMPWSLFAFGLAGITLIGLPPSGGFVAKWLMLSSAIRSGQWWWVMVLLGGGLLTAAYVFRVLRAAFVPPLPGSSAWPVPGPMQYAAFTLALLALALGLVAPVPLELLSIGAPFELAAGESQPPPPAAPALGGADSARELLEDFTSSDAAP